MKLIRLSIILLVVCLLTSALVTVEAQDSTLLTTVQSSNQANSSSRVGHASPNRFVEENRRVQLSLRRPCYTILNFFPVKRACLLQLILIR